MLMYPETVLFEAIWHDLKKYFGRFGEFFNNFLYKEKTSGNFLGVFKGVFKKLLPNKIFRKSNRQ